MGSRRKNSVYGLSLLPILAGACLLVGCVPPPEPAAEPPEIDVHKKEHHRHNENEGADSPRHHEEKREEPARSSDAKSGAPEKVLVVLKYVEENHEAPPGYEGGREFHNNGGQGEEALPRRDAHDRTVKYQEWDVNRHAPGVNRGAERLITGSDGSAYFTSDHYKTFTKIK